MIKCHGQEGNQYWHYTSDRHIQHGHNRNLCLEITLSNVKKREYKPHLVPCDSSKLEQVFSLSNATIPGMEPARNRGLWRGSFLEKFKMKEENICSFFLSSFVSVCLGMFRSCFICLFILLRLLEYKVSLFFLLWEKIRQCFKIYYPEMIEILAAGHHHFDNFMK